jgi:regulator of replication initiation timing
MMTEECSTIPSELGEEIKRLSKRVEELEQRNQELEAENKHLKEMLYKQGASKESKSPQFKANYSVEKHKGKGKGKRWESQRDDVPKMRSTTL